MGAFVLYLVVVGVLAGYMGSLPAASSARIAVTALVGTLGSAAGGVAGFVLFDEDFGDVGFPSGAYLGCLVGAVAALGAYGVARAMPRRSS